MTVHQIEPHTAVSDRLSPEERTAAREMLAAAGGPEAMLGILLADISAQLAELATVPDRLVVLEEFASTATEALAKFASFKMPAGLGALFGGGK